MTPIRDHEHFRDALTVGTFTDLPNKRTCARLLALVLFILLPFSFAFAGPEKIARDLQNADPNSTVDVIIQFKHFPTETDHQKVRAKGGVLKTQLDVVKGGVYSVPTEALTTLADDPDVAYISPDRQVKGLLDYTAAAVNAPVAWNTYGLDGKGIAVAIIDSGITDHPDLRNATTGKSRIVYTQSFIQGRTADYYGHGTHVAGIVAGDGASSTGSDYTRTFRGIAPGTNLINLRALDDRGVGHDSGVIPAIQKAIELKNTYDIRVINVSLGRPVFESYTLDPLCQAVEAAWKAGIVVVVAAGNEGRNNSASTNGYGTITSPGNDPYVITVGAMKTLRTFFRGDDLIASYSSKGPTLFDHVVKPDIVAPGNRVISLLDAQAYLESAFPQNEVPLSYYQETSSTRVSTNYYTLSGTSMATAVVTGAAALLLQKAPTLTPDQVKARLMKTASKAFPASSIATDPLTGAIYTSQYDIFTIGAGYLDIAAALASTDIATGSAKSPTAVYDSSTGLVRIATDPTTVWNGSLVWGTGVVWGAGVFVNSNSVLWGSSVVWGTSTMQGFSLIWGTSLVWGTSTQNAVESINVAILGEN